MQPQDAQGTPIIAPYQVLLNLKDSSGNNNNYPGSSYATYDPITGTSTFNVGTGTYLPPGTYTIVVKVADGTGNSVTLTGLSTTTVTVS